MTDISRPYVVLLALSLMAATCLSSAPAEAREIRRLTPFGCCGYAPDADPFDTDIPPDLTPPEPRFRQVPPFGGGGEPQFVPGPSAQPGPAPYPQGFVLDVPVEVHRDGESGKRSATTLNRYRQVADALADCWDPPPQFADKAWKQVTLRVSFKRDGTVNGMPRIPFVDEGLTGQARSDLTNSLMDALKRCTPLPFSPSLGGAVAGQVFALRFIEKDQN